MQLRKGHAWETIVVALEIYAILLIIFLLTMQLPVRPWPVEMLCQFLSWALLPSIFVFIGFISTRRWRAATLWVIPTIAFCYLFGGLFLPSPEMQLNRDALSSGTGKHLRVMTYNLRGKAIGDLSAQIELIRDSGASIIALQEVSQQIADLIDSQLDEIYPYRVLYPDGIAGTGILSKYPIEDHDIYKISPNLFNHCRATIDVEGTPVTVISSHPPPPTNIAAFRFQARRYREIKELVRMASEGGPSLLMGDFNMTDQSSDYRVPRGAGLHDTYREAGWGFGTTWPARIKGRVPCMTLMRIDYIWHTDEFYPVSVHVGGRAVSDHLPVIADFVYVARANP